MERPDVLPSVTIRRETPCGGIYVTVTYDRGRAFEIFVKYAKPGTCAHAIAATIGTLCSRALRSGRPVGEVIEDLCGMSCAVSGPERRSCVTVIGEVLRDFPTDERSIGESDLPAPAA